MAIADTFSNLGTAIINYVNRKTGPATTSKLGQVKPDGTTITVDANGVISAGSGGGHIGEIVKSLTPLNEAGLHLLDGSVINNGSYAQFVSHMASLYASNPSLFVTESEWQTATSAYGVCGKFVYDSAKKTVRLPKVTGIIEGTTDLSALGDLIEAGLPEHTHTFTRPKGDQNYGNGNGNTWWGATSGVKVTTSKASTSNSIYGKSTTVQPQTIKVLYYIVIAQSAKTELQVDIDNIATDLNGKADVDYTNCSYLPMRNDVVHIVETYVNGSSGYRIFSDGYCEQWGRTGALGYGGSATINLLKKFKDVNYSISGATNYAQTTGNKGSSWAITSLEQSSFVWRSGFEQWAAFIYWKACGYLA